LDGMLRGEGCAVTYVTDPGLVTAEALCRQDAVVMYAVSAALPAGNLEALLDAVRGVRCNDRDQPVGLVGLHGVTTSFQDSNDWKRLIGASFISHPDMGPAYHFTVKDPDHPVMSGVADFDLVDELYFSEVHARFSVLLSCTHEGIERPVAWHKQYGRGKVFYLALGHDVEQLGNGHVRRMIANGVRWTVR
jgi:type 1 glutamine amidotransferase